MRAHLSLTMSKGSRGQCLVAGTTRVSESRVQGPIESIKGSKGQFLVAGTIQKQNLLAIMRVVRTTLMLPSCRKVCYVGKKKEKQL